MHDGSGGVTRFRCECGAERRATVSSRERFERWTFGGSWLRKGRVAQNGIRINEELLLHPTTQARRTASNVRLPTFRQLLRQPLQLCICGLTAGWLSHQQGRRRDALSFGHTVRHARTARLRCEFTVPLACLPASRPPLAPPRHACRPRRRACSSRPRATAHTVHQLWPRAAEGLNDRWDRLSDGFRRDVFSADVLPQEERPEEATGGEPAVGRITRSGRQW